MTPPRRAQPHTERAPDTGAPARGSRFAAIATSLRRDIHSGTLGPGAPVPSEAQLSAQYAVSRGTVRQALAALRAEGLIVGGRGRSPRVTRSILAQSFDQMISFSAWAESLGRTPSARTLELKRRPVGGEAARKLALEPGTPVFEYKRLRLLDGEPAMVELTTFVEWVGRLVIDCDLDGGSVYAQLGERGVVFGEAHQAIAAIAASAEQAALLGVPRRAPLLEVAPPNLRPQRRGARSGPLRHLPWRRIRDHGAFAGRPGARGRGPDIARRKRERLIGEPSPDGRPRQRGSSACELAPKGCPKPWQPRAGRPAATRPATTLRRALPESLEWRLRYTRVDVPLSSPRHG